MSKKQRGVSVYLKSGRLSDVLALIQILAYDRLAKRSNSGLVEELRRPPLTADDWIEIGRQHPELFRVLEGEQHHSGKDTVALIARYVQEPLPSSNPNEPPRSPPLASGVTAKLMEMAIELHDREFQRRDRWKSVLVPTAVAVIAAAAAIISAVINTRFKDSPPVVAATSTPAVAAPKPQELPSQPVQEPQSPVTPQPNNPLQPIAPKRAPAER